MFFGDAAYADQGAGLRLGGGLGELLVGEFSVGADDASIDAQDGFLPNSWG